MCELLGPDDREDNEKVASCQEALGGKEIAESWKKCVARYKRKSCSCLNVTLERLEIDLFRQLRARGPQIARSEPRYAIEHVT